MSDVNESAERQMRIEEEAVRELGKRIRVMQAAERLWGDALEADGLPRGGAHSVGCCVAFLVPCPGCTDHKTCDWCCGAGRVTKRVAQAIREARRQLGE